MRLTFWGTRGSITNPGPDKVQYGANTACVSIQEGNERLILDAGLGIVLLGDRIMDWRLPKEQLHLNLFLSHLHWDHVIGLPFFTPVFFQNIDLSIWGRSVEEIESATERLFTSNYSPINGTANLGAKLHYKAVGSDPVEVGPFTVTTSELHHPGGSLAFRVQSGDKSIVYASDHESGNEEADQALVDLSRGANVLIHDAQWTLTEQTRYPGFGHSTWSHAVDHARDAGVEHLILFHHHHRHDDLTLDAIGRKATEAAPKGLKVTVARDGLVFDP